MKKKKTSESQKQQSPFQRPSMISPFINKPSRNGPWPRLIMVPSCTVLFAVRTSASSLNTSAWHVEIWHWNLSNSLPLTSLSWGRPVVQLNVAVHMLHIYFLTLTENCVFFQCIKYKIAQYSSHCVGVGVLSLNSCLACQIDGKYACKWSIRIDWACGAHMLTSSKHYNLQYYNLIWKVCTTCCIQWDRLAW